MTALPRWPRRFVLAAGPAACLLGILAAPDSLPDPARPVFAVTLWMVVWWLTEAVPLAVTALLPLALFPTLGVMSTRDAAAPYASELVFLFLAGFLLAAALEYWRAHARLAYGLVAAVGVGARRIVLGVMLATAFLSMWISNTATAAMMYPIAIAIGGLLGEGAGPARTRTALMLGVAYAASIGGMATLIGTPPNLVLAAFLRERFGIEVDMVQWLKVGLPFTAILLPCAWWYLTRIACRSMPRTLPGSRTLFADQLRALGPPSRGERVVLVVFCTAVLGWMLRPQIVALTGLRGLSDAVIAMTAALALFVIPVDTATRTFAMNWDTAKKLPWEILLLFGGGLTLADAIARHGVDAWLASGLHALAGAPLVVVVLAISTMVVFLTEITSNTAVTATLLPVFAATAAVLGVPPAPLLVATALAASCAFMLPVATPPNAIVFSTGHVTIAQMARAGFALNLLCIAVVTALVTAGVGSGILE